MTIQPVISLLTDFGLTDEYVGVMKGVITSICFQSPMIIDITHGIQPQNIIQAALILDASYSFFPQHTIHTIVVDPGVGSQRKTLMLEQEGYCFVAPDNGVLSLVCQKNVSRRIFQINAPHLYLHPVSHTFHGRDIFAPISAHLANGISLTEIGSEIDISQLSLIDLPKPYQEDPFSLWGKVIAVDHFGNLITNIKPSHLQAINGMDNLSSISIQNDHFIINGISESYQNVPVGSFLAIFASRGYLEIAVNCGNAFEKINRQLIDINLRATQ